MSNFWRQLTCEHKPFFCLAPMEDVTDIAFREMFARYSKTCHKCILKMGSKTIRCIFENRLSLQCTYGTLRAPTPTILKNTSDCFCVESNLVLFTEFTPSDGLAFGDEKAQEKLRAKLSYTEAQRPIVAQIYNSNPERMQNAAELVQDLGFDGVDINMGCPVNAVVKQVSGAALIKHPDLAVEIIEATKRGAPNIPVSVKTRIGYSSKDEMHDWLAKILATKIDALTVHLRTRNQFSKVPADWSLMREIVKLRDKISPSTVIIGNGDVQSVEQGRELAEKYGCDGIMVGRGAFGKPDFFAGVCGCYERETSVQSFVKSLIPTNFLQLFKVKNVRASEDRFSKTCTEVSLSYKQKIRMLIEHIELFDRYLLQPKHKGYHVMKKHFKAYISGWHGAKELRAKLMETHSPQEAMKILKSVI